MVARAHLETERLVLRPLSEDDEAAVVTALDDIQVVRWLAVVPYPYRAEHFRSWQPMARPGEVWAVDSPGGLIGVVSLALTQPEDSPATDSPAPESPTPARSPAPDSPAPGSAAADDSTRAGLAPDSLLPNGPLPNGPRLELGYWFARASWGRGYGSEAVRAVIAAHFADPAAAPIYAHVHDGNIRSESVLTGMGFTILGPRRYYADALKREVDAITLRLTRPDWVQANPLRIGTARLLIEPLAEPDAGPFRRLVTFPAVGRNLLIFPPDWTLKAARSFVEANRWTGELPYRLAIRRRGDEAGALIGMIGLLPGDEPEIVYAIDPAEGRQGLMSEAVEAFIADIARRLDPPAIRARVFADNGQSAGLLRKLGFAALPGDAMIQSAARPAPAPVVTYRLALRGAG